MDGQQQQMEITDRSKDGKIDDHHHLVHSDLAMSVLLFAFYYSHHLLTKLNHTQHHVKSQTTPHTVKQVKCALGGISIMKGVAVHL